jgi:hypothetical protein
MTDSFEYHTAGIVAPLTAAQTVSPSDSLDLDQVSRALYVGTSGNVKVTMKSGGTVTLAGLAAGLWHPVRVSRIWATGTTAAGILAGW